MPDLKTAVPTLQLLHQEAARRLSLRAPMLVDSFMHDMAWFDYPKTVDHLQNTPAIAQSLPEQHRRRLFADSKQTTATAAASVPPAPGTSPPPCGTVTPPPGGTPSHAINAVATNTDSNEKKQQAPAPLVAEAMPLSKRLLCNMGEAGEPLSDEVTSPYKLTCVATAAVLKTEFVSAFASAAQPASPASRRPASMTEEEVRHIQFTCASPHVFQTPKNRSSAPLESWSEHKSTLSSPSRQRHTALNAFTLWTCFKR